MGILIYAITFLFIALWAYASFPKFLNMKRFHYVMLSQLIPKWLANVLFVILPIFEIGILTILLFDKTRLLGMYLSFFTMLIFTIYIGGAAFNIYKIYLCPCGRLFSKMSWKKHFFVNLVLTIIALSGIFLM